MKNLSLNIMVILACCPLISTYFMSDININKDIPLILYIFIILTSLLSILESVKNAKKINTIEKLVSENERLEKEARSKIEALHQEKKNSTNYKTKLHQVEKNYNKKNKDLSLKLERSQELLENLEKNLTKLQKVKKSEDNQRNNASVIQLLHLLQKKR